MTRNQAALLISLMYPTFRADDKKPLALNRVRYGLGDFDEWRNDWHPLFDGILTVRDGDTDVWLSPKPEFVLRRLPKRLLADFIVSNWVSYVHKCEGTGVPVGPSEVRLVNEAKAFLRALVNPSRELGTGKVS